MKTATSSPAKKRRLPGPLTAASTREKLIEAAGPVFAEHGYYAATVRDIARRAGSNVAAVNYHFGDKLGLYTEVLRRSVRDAKVESLRNVLDQQAPPEEILRSFIRVRMQNLCKHDRADLHFRLMVHELALPSPALSRVVNEVSRPIYKRVLEVIGAMTNLPPEEEKTRLCAHSIMGQIFIYFLAAPFLVRLWPDLTMTPEQVERIAEHVGEFSLAYLRQLGRSLKADPWKPEEVGNGGTTRD